MAVGRQDAASVAHDATLWTGTDEAQWLGWLDIVEEQLAHASELKNLSQEITNAGFKDALLLGMGGSSLCPEVLRKTFGNIASHPDLHVLDSTDPAQVKAFENKDRHCQNTLHRLEQIGQHTRTQHFQAVFF